MSIILPMLWWVCTRDTMMKATPAEYSPLSKLSLARVNAAVPELTDGLLARFRITSYSFRGTPNITAWHWIIATLQVALRSSTTLDIMQEDRSYLPKESAAELGDEPSTSMLPVSTQLHREQQPGKWANTQEHPWRSKVDRKSSQSRKGNFGSNNNSLHVFYFQLN